MDKSSDYGINLQTLKNWNQERLQNILAKEESKQEIAVSRVRNFIDALGLI
jgi:hypothetical protein